MHSQSQLIHTHNAHNYYPTHNTCKHTHIGKQRTERERLTHAHGGHDKEISTAEFAGGGDQSTTAWRGKSSTWKELGIMAEELRGLSMVHAKARQRLNVREGELATWESAVVVIGSRQRRWRMGPWGVAVPKVG